MQSKNNRIKGGVFKNKNVNIIEIDNFGHPHLRFKTVDYKFVNSAMQDLTTAFSWAFNNDKIDVLLLIPCFILDFLCIHPFRDGNGRMSRLLSVLLLYQTGYDVVKYISFENEINKTRDYYYDSLHQSSINWHTNKHDYMPFVENFLFMILRCYKEINNRFILVKNKKPTKAQRIYEIIKLNPCPTSKKNIKEMMPDTAIRTIELTLNKLVNQNKINRIGSKKQSTYIPAAAN
jgi:Fic family protein